MQVERNLEINNIHTVTKEVVEVAQEEGQGPWASLRGYAKESQNCSFDETK